MRTLLLGLLLIPLHAASAGQAPSGVRDGIWEGLHSRSQAGDCGGASQPVRLRVGIASRPDGSLTVQQAGVPAEFDWTGRIADGTVTFDVPRRTTCNGKQSRRVHSYSGPLPDAAKDAPGLTLRGVEDMCPDMGCHVIKHEIGAALEPDGRRMLRLAGMDVPCIQSGCRFQSLIEVEFKADSPPPLPR